MSGAVRAGAGADAVVTGVVHRASDVRAGSLFVALPGTSADGHAFIADAARRGAAAIIVERDVGGAPDVPLVRVADTRRALAELAAAWHGRPADRLGFVGITGTAGKTSTLSLLEAVLVAAGEPIATIGSLGVAIQGEPREETVYTTPDPLVLHDELARIAEAGSELVAMEVTSHALMQDRVHGLAYDLGIFTNLLPLEHSGYHPTFRDYIDAKALFLDLLAPGAPLIYNVDDPVTCRLLEDRDLTLVPCGTGERATVRARTTRVDATGTRLRLRSTEEIAGFRDTRVPPLDLEIRLQLLGRSSVANVVLAATAALCLGVDPAVIPPALAAFPPPRRRLEVLHRGRFTILDDTVGHPESISIVFELAGKLEPRRVHVAYAVRGQRGDRINRENGEALSVWADRLGVETLVVTRSADTADDLNRVEEREYEAFVAPLREHGVDYEEQDRLDDAVHAVLGRARDGDLVLLLGAQGMNQGREVARAWLADHGETGGTRSRTS